MGDNEARVMIGQDLEVNITNVDYNNVDYNSLELVCGSNWYVFKAWPSKNGAWVYIQLEFQARGSGTCLMLRTGTSSILWLPDQELGTRHVHNDLSCSCGSSENMGSSQLPM